MRYAEQLHPQLHPMRLASRTGRLYTGPCPFCPDGGEDRFHVWMAASGDRPAERYWCRVCNRSGLLKHLDHDGEARAATPPRHSTQTAPSSTPPRPEPNPTHVPFYRELYAATALWAHSWLLDGCHPDPLGYLHTRGLHDETVRRYLFGVTLRDPPKPWRLPASAVPHGVPVR